MKKFIFLLIVSVIWSCSPSEKSTEEVTTDHSAHSTEESTESAAKPKSPKQMSMSNVGNNHVHIEYSSPSKRGRQIFGGLVAYGEVWVTGAHNATSINFTTDVQIGDTVIEKGKYALFTIPGEDTWTIIINTNWDQHLADDYSIEEDVVRVEVSPKSLDEEVEALTFEVTEIDENSGTISISWGSTSVSFNLTNI